MWTGSDWQIYSQKLDGTEFGTPGRISKDNMKVYQYPSLAIKDTKEKLH